MYKVKIDIRGASVMVLVKDTETDEEKYQISEIITGDPEERARSIATGIISRMKAEKQEHRIIEYVVE